MNIEIGNVYEDTNGNSFEVIKFNKNSVYVVPMDEQIRFTREEFEDQFSESDGEEDSQEE
jgi:hypothetical protein